MRTLNKRLHENMTGDRKRMFWFFMCTLLILCSLYVYFVNTAARNGVLWSDRSRERSSLAAQTAELESSYLSLKQSVTLSLAYRQGFEDVRSVTFINPKTLGAVTRSNEL